MGVGAERSSLYTRISQWRIQVVGNGGGGGAHPSKSSMWWVGDPIMK